MYAETNQYLKRMMIKVEDRSLLFDICKTFIIFWRGGGGDFVSLII